MANIILAHGILGAGALPVLRKGVYFNGVATLYERLGHKVLQPTVSTMGSLDQRSRQLAATIRTNWPDERDMIIVAHSMGGLDARRVLFREADIAERVRCLITVATPHLGSPVADAVLNAVGNPDRVAFRRNIPQWLLDHADALRDLRSRDSLHDPDRAGVRYVRVGCDCRTLRFRSPVFDMTQHIGGLPPDGNDGVVTLASQCPPAQPCDAELFWPVDHGGAIGWPSGMWGWQATWATFSPPEEHLARYRALLTV